MLDKLIRWSLDNRPLVILLTLLLSAAGVWVAFRVPVDVLPDLTAPTVTVMTEAHGMAPEEVETLVTFPIETAINGAPGVRRVRSSSVAGLSTVWVEFDWGADIYRARQVVAEKVQGVSDNLPEGTVPELSPVSSVMGEIMYVALREGGVAGSRPVSRLALRETADYVVKRRLLSVPGVSQVVAIGGDVRQFQVTADPVKLEARGLALADLHRALAASNRNFSAGIVETNGRQEVIRGIGRFRDAADIAMTAVSTAGGVPVLLGDVAEVGVGAAFRTGDAAVDGRPAVLLAVLKHPDANTLDVIARVDKALDELDRSLPAGMVLDRKLYRQSDFILPAVRNIGTVLLEGSLLVLVILFLFLGNVRSTLISVAAMPVSLIFAVFVLRFFDASINTMTLGGMAIAIGIIVDDAIIDVENVFRRLRENASRAEDQRVRSLDVVFGASREIRSSIVNATLIIVLVFVPLFFLGGLEGRLLKPLGLSYVISIGASLLVALTLTPALCAVLLPRSRAVRRERESLVARALTAGYRPLLRFAIRHPLPVIALALAVFAGSLLLLFRMGRSFLPTFNEGALTVMVASPPGTDLTMGSVLAAQLEKKLRTHPCVVKTSRITGRGEQDEHGKPPGSSEVDLQLDLRGRRFSEVVDELRALSAGFPGLAAAFGQPVSHRIDHMMSGATANIAIKIFGTDLAVLRGLAETVRARLAGIRGLVDLSVEQQAETPQVRVVPDRERLARAGLTVEDLAETLETAVSGCVTTKVMQKERVFDVVLRLPASCREDRRALEALRVRSASGVQVPLASVAEVRPASGPPLIQRENGMRKIMVTANVSGRDLRGVFEDVRARVEREVKLPEGYFVQYGGQFESEAEATRTLLLLSLVSLTVIVLILAMEFRSLKTAVLITLNLPLAFSGGIVAVWCSGGVISVAALVGFVTLFGIATRNGILLVSHYRYLEEEENLPPGEAVWKGSLERLRPVVMTTLAAGLAMLPFAFRAEQPGNEILAPMAVVILGGLAGATVLNLLVIPALFGGFARRRERAEVEEEA